MFFTSPLYQQSGVTGIALSLTYGELKNLKVAPKIHDAIKYPCQYH
jgi:hypothetical protein